MISQIFFPNLWRHRHLLSTRCWYLQHPELCSCNNLLLAPPPFINERINDPSMSWLNFAQNSPATHCSAACFALTSLSNKCFIRIWCQPVGCCNHVQVARSILAPLNRSCNPTQLIEQAT